MEWLKMILEKVTVNDEGKIDVDALLKDITTEFPKHAVPKADYNAKSEEVKTANTTIDQLKKDNADNEQLQDSVKGYKAEVERLQKESSNTKKMYSLQSALKDIGCADPDYLIFKHGGIEKFTFDDTGKPIGINEVTKPYMESNKVLFPTGQKEQRYNPSGGSGSGSINPFAKETWNMTEQGKLFNENPAQAREMAQAAGVNI